MCCLGSRLLRAGRVQTCSRSAGRRQAGRGMGREAEGERALDWRQKAEKTKGCWWQLVSREVLVRAQS